MRLNSFDYFRAIAIIFIVAGHSYTPWAIDTVIEKTVANLILGNTAFFVFISGFFFHYKFLKNFNYYEFIVKKSKSILVPYVIMSTFAFYIIVVMLQQPHDTLIRSLDGPGDIFLSELEYLWTGRVMFAYWYVPFIMLMFLMSPLFIKYIALRTPQRLTIFIVLLLLSTYIQRPYACLSPIHSVIYYLPVYLAGILISMHKETVYQAIHNKCLLLGILTLAISFFYALYYPGYGNFYKPDLWSNNGVDILIFQKFIFILFILSLLNNLENREYPALKHIASMSFAIYFLHPVVIFVFDYLSLFDILNTLPGFIIFMIKLPIIIGICILLALLFRQVLGMKSRYVIGW